MRRKPGSSQASSPLPGRAVRTGASLFRVSRLSSRPRAFRRRLCCFFAASEPPIVPTIRTARHFWSWAFALRLFGGAARNGRRERALAFIAVRPRNSPPPEWRASRGTRWRRSCRSDCRRGRRRKGRGLCVTALGGDRRSGAGGNRGRGTGRRESVRRSGDVAHVREKGVRGRVAQRRLGGRRWSEYGRKTAQESGKAGRSARELLDTTQGFRSRLWTCGSSWQRQQRGARKR
jgi:hypothetical protein